MNKIKDETLKIQQETDKNFLSSAEYKIMISRIEFLESQVKALEITNDALNQKNLQLLSELAKI